MRVLIYSDLHANWEALEAMAAYTAGRYDTSLCLGDLVGYGANPNETAAWARRHTPLTIRGNHDRAGAELHGLEWFNANAAAAARWTHAALDPDLKGWLTRLPPGPAEWNGVLLAHGSPLEEDQYVVEAPQAAEVFAATTAPLIFFGHTHLQGGFALAPGTGAVRRLDAASPKAAGSGDSSQATVPIELDKRYLINPGSVGQPRDGDWRAGFALYDTEAATVTFHRIPYDVERAQAKIREAGLPESLARRLARGQ